MKPVRGYQDWRDLLFLHWPVDAAQLRRLLPAGLRLDLHRGTAWVGLVAFGVTGARHATVPQGVALEFLEANLRTYVRLSDGAPGVYFLSMDAASRLAVWAARLWYGLPYHHASMQSSVEGEGATRVHRFVSERDGGGPRLEVAFRPAGPVERPAPASVERFLLERFSMYFERRRKLWRGDVEHAPFRLQRAQLLAFEDEIAGSVGLPEPDGTPLAHYVSGAEVAILTPVPCEEPARRFAFEPGLTPAW